METNGEWDGVGDVDDAERVVQKGGLAASAFASRAISAEALLDARRVPCPKPTTTASCYNRFFGQVFLHADPALLKSALSRPTVSDFNSTMGNNSAFVAENERAEGYTHVILITTGSVASVKAPLIVSELLSVRQTIIQVNFMYQLFL